MPKVSDYYLYQRGKKGLWYFGYRVDGKEIKVATRTTDKKAAEEQAKKARVEALKVSEDGFAAATASAEDCFRVFRQRFLKGRDPKVLRQHDVFADRFTRFFGKLPLASITTYRAEDWRDWLVQQETSCKHWGTQRPLSAKYINEHLIWLGAVCRYHKLTNPVASIKRVRRTKDQKIASAVKFYSDDEVESLNKAAEGTVFRLPYLLMLHLGCRPAELKFLKNSPEHFDRNSQTVYLIDKRQRVRGLELTGDFQQCWDWFMEWIAGRKVKRGAFLFPQGKSWLLKGWHRLQIKAWLTPSYTHSLRHNFVRNAFHRLGWDLSKISMWCGHESDICYSVYAKIFVQSPTAKNRKITLKPKDGLPRTDIHVVEKGIIVWEALLTPESYIRFQHEIRQTPELRESIRYNAMQELDGYKHQDFRSAEAETVTISLKEYKALVERAGQGEFKGAEAA